MVNFIMFFVIFFKIFNLYWWWNSIFYLSDGFDIIIFKKFWKFLQNVKFQYSKNIQHFTTLNDKFYIVNSFEFKKANLFTKLQSFNLHAIQLQINYFNESINTINIIVNGLAVQKKWYTYEYCMRSISCVTFWFLLVLNDHQREWTVTRDISMALNYFHSCNNKSPKLNSEFMNSLLNIKYGGQGILTFGIM